MENKVLLNDSNQDQTQISSPSSPIQERSVTPDNQILETPTGSPNVINPPASHCSPVRRRAAPNLGPIRFSVQQQQAIAEHCRRLPESGPFDFINLTTGVEAKLDTMGLSGTAALKQKQVLYKEAIEQIKREERLINREQTQEVQDTNAEDFEIIRIALRNLQREIDASAEETCGPPTKFQRSGSPSNDGGPGNSSASHMKASPPKMACLSASRRKAKKELVSTIEQPLPTPIRSENNGGVVVAAGVVGAVIGIGLFCKYSIYISKPIKSWLQKWLGS